jgi:hypothetical protein
MLPGTAIAPDSGAPVPCGLFFGCGLRKERLMDAAGFTPGNAGAVEKRARILYSLLLVAAVAVIVFSVVGIAAMMGWIAAD